MNDKSLDKAPDKARDRPLLVCVMGPTASGKTDLAVALAGHLDCELISVDSALVYRGLDIGAARPAFPHHLVDVRDPAEPYTAADFAADAAHLVSEITGRGRVPVLVGGSMLYFRAYLEGLAPMPPADRAVRAQIEAAAAAHGWPSVHRQLAAVDPGAAARIHPNHSQRLSRALEVYRVSGVSLTDWHRAQREAAASPGPGASHRLVQIAISPAERGVLHARIEQRFARMLDDGLLEEVRALWRRGDLHPDLPALRAVGYRQLWRYLEGRCELEEAVAGAVAATRQLARRQLTWLRKWPDLKWIITDQAGNSSPISRSDNYAGGGRERPPVEVALNYLHLASK